MKFCSLLVKKLSQNRCITRTLIDVETELTEELLLDICLSIWEFLLLGIPRSSQLLLCQSKKLNTLQVLW